MTRKQNNFYLRWYEAQRAGKTAARRALLLWLLPAVLLVTACLAALAVVLVQTYGLRTRSASILGWCYDEPNYTSYARSVTDQQDTQYYRDQAQYARDLTGLLESYPRVTSALLNRIEAAGNASISIIFRSYDAATGTLTFEAASNQVIDIPAYIRSLEGCGAFSRVRYTGYSSQNESYTIHITCTLAAPAAAGQAAAQEAAP